MSCCAAFARWMIRPSQLLREFPKVRVIECATQTPNQKVGVLVDLAREARYPILIVNDADIRVSRITSSASPRLWRIQAWAW